MFVDTRCDDQREQDVRKGGDLCERNFTKYDAAALLVVTTDSFLGSDRVFPRRSPASDGVRACASELASWVVVGYLYFPRLQVSLQRHIP
jgi:hypothetical protein